MSNAMIAKNDEVTLRVVFDTCGESPRDWDNLGKMICWHSRHSLGDKHNYEDTADLFRSLIREVLDKRLMKKIILYVKQGNSQNLKLEYNRSTREWELSSYSAWTKKWYLENSFAAPLDYESDALFDSIIELLEAEDMEDFVKEYYTILPLYLYDHSGLTMNTCGFSCPWDSGQVGWIYCSHKKMEEETGYTIDELFSKDKNRVPKVGERVKISSRDDFGKIKSISNGKAVIDFDYNKALEYRKKENTVLVSLSEITEVLSNKAEEILISEVETYDQYLRGNVYGFILETNDGKHIDSCYGFYGDNFKENGMLEYIPDEYRDLVNKLEAV